MPLSSRREAACQRFIKEIRPRNPLYKLIRSQVVVAEPGPYTLRATRQLYLKGLCHDLRMRAQLEKVCQFFQVSSGWFPSHSILAIAVSIILWLSPTFKVVFLLVLRCYIFVLSVFWNFSERCNANYVVRVMADVDLPVADKRIYSSAVVRNRTWTRGHGQIWSDSIIFSSWVAAKLENAAMDTDSKSKSTRGINMTKKGGIRLVYVWAYCDGHMFAKHIEINCLDQWNLTSFQHDFAVDPQWLSATIAAVGELTVALLSV